MPTCSLREHCARLTRDDDGWLLRYPIARHRYGSHEVELVEVMVPLAVANYADARKLAQVSQLVGTGFTAECCSRVPFSR